MSDDLFLIANSNGNGESFLLVLASGSNCAKQFKAKTIEAMAQYLGDERLADVQENIIVADTLPCENCSKHKKCTEMKNLVTIDQPTVNRIFNLVSEEHGENIRDYLDTDE